MTLLSTILFFVACHSLVNIILVAGILNRPRDWLFSLEIPLLSKLLTCPLCLGFWVPIVFWAMGSPTGVFYADMFVSSLWCWLNWLGWHKLQFGYWSHDGPEVLTSEPKGKGEPQQPGCSDCANSPQHSEQPDEVATDD